MKRTRQRINWLVARRCGTWIGTALCLVALLAVGGCAPSPAKKIVGSWQLDAEGALNLLASAEIRLTFKAEGQLEISSKVPVVGTVTQGGTWKFLSINDQQMRVEANIENMEKPIILEITIVDDNTIRLVPPTGPIKTEARFKRVGG